jgi:hypothetical protein
MTRFGVAGSFDAREVNQPITAMMTNYSQPPDLESGELKIRPTGNGLNCRE